MKLSEKYGASPINAVNKLLFTSFTFSELFTLKKWTVLWSTYALYDPAYADQESFGFFIDTGNGWNTFLPSILFLVTMTVHPPSISPTSSFSFLSTLLSARNVGIIGMLKYYQEFYGTIMCTIAYFYNKRHLGKSVVECSLVVGISNSLWFFFPAFGMLICYRMIMENTFDMFITRSSSSIA